ncbi:hypothetical protein [Microbacterium capsulatum]|uniref:Uncharacterized protein n=1 Tax=Microbacterium capsulatum TaxID=3041921 RepID=A0ABU0XJE7_9MICO|nr:hypothetical protein [Microbacterium sp. ASV81]MDQ4215252.1 hypothetical protein [Microbacterium sp. ASV81]
MKFLTVLSWFLILLVRGCLLWILIAFAWLAWISVHSWAQDASPSQTVTWYDRNVVSALANGPFRLLILPSERPQFIGLADMGKIKPNRITLLTFN